MYVTRHERIGLKGTQNLTIWISNFDNFLLKHDLSMKHLLLEQLTMGNLHSTYNLQNSYNMRRR